MTCPVKVIDYPGGERILCYLCNRDIKAKLTEKTEKTRNRGDKKLVGFSDAKRAA